MSTTPIIIGRAGIATIQWQNQTFLRRTKPTSKLPAQFLALLKFLCFWTNGNVFNVLLWIFDLNFETSLNSIKHWLVQNNTIATLPLRLTSQKLLKIIIIHWDEVTSNHCPQVFIFYLLIFEVFEFQGLMYQYTQTFVCILLLTHSNVLWQHSSLMCKLLTARTKAESCSNLSCLQSHDCLKTIITQCEKYNKTQIEFTKIKDAIILNGKLHPLNFSLCRGYI